MQHCVHCVHARPTKLAHRLRQPVNSLRACTGSDSCNLYTCPRTFYLLANLHHFRQHTGVMAPAALCLTCSMTHNPSASVHNTMCRKCRSLLQIYEPSVLITVGTNQAVASSGLNQATRQFHQVPLGRGCFDDTKVLHCLLAQAKDNPVLTMSFS